MRTAAALAVFVATALTAAGCAAPTDPEAETGTSEQAFLRPIKIIWPPPPLPAYTTISGYAGSPLQQGHADGSGVTTFVRPELVASSPGGATFVIDKDPANWVDARLRIVFDTIGTVNPHVQTILRGFYLNGAAGLAMDPQELAAYFTSPGTNNIYKVTLGGYVDRFAGAVHNGDFGPNHGHVDGERYWGSMFNAPEGIVRTVTGTFYVADTGNRVIRKIAPDGMVSTLWLTGAPSGFAPHALAHDARTGILYTTHRSGIYAISPAGQVSLVAGHEFLMGHRDGAPLSALFSVPKNLTVDDSGNVFVADPGNGTLRKLVVNWGSSITSVETINNLAPSTFNPFGSGGYGPNDPTIHAPFGVAMWGNSLLFTDVGRHTLRRLQ